MSVHFLPMFQSAPVPARREALLDWLETHSGIMGFWLDRLIEEGDEGEFVTMLHRQQSWLDMMQDRLRRAG